MLWWVWFDRANPERRSGPLKAGGVMKRGGQRVWFYRWGFRKLSLLGHSEWSS